MTTTMARKTIDRDTAEQMAFDEACGFFTDEQLCTRYRLTIEQLQAVRKKDAFRARVDENSRLLADEGSEFLIKAKSYAADALDALHQITMNPEVGPSVREKTATRILEFAGLTRKKDSSGDSGGGVGLTIHTNLQLNQSPEGTYQVTAAPTVQRLDEQGEGNQDLVETNG